MQTQQTFLSKYKSLIILVPNHLIWEINKEIGNLL